MTLVLEPPEAGLLDSLGPIPIPPPPTISAFPVLPDFGTGMDYQPPIVVHTFGQAGIKTEQRFLMAPLGPRRFRFAKNHLSCREYDDLKGHWEQAQGMYAQFPLTVYEPAGQQTYTVRYENPTLAFDYMIALLTQGPGITFLETPTATPSYSPRARLSRFPDSSLTTALQSEIQQIIPVISITSRDGSATLYLSNQRCSISGKLYLPRLLDWSGISQTLGESSDAASFNFGNADGVWTQLINQVNLYGAPVQFSLYHVADNSLLDLWAGYVTNWQYDTSGKFQVNVADGVFQMTLPYPSRKILRTCWKVYKGRFCPSTSSYPDCPKDYDSCVARGVPHSFGGVVFPPQAVRIKDNSTGVMGFGRSGMTSVSVVQDTVYQRPLQEVFTDVQMLVNCDVAEGRDESDFYSALGVIGEGPLSTMDSNLIRHSLDGQPPHDPINGGGWRYMLGNDPSNPNDFVGITQAPWNVAPPGSTYAAGIAMAEIRRTDQKGLQLSAVSDHAMIVSVTGGLGGWYWTGPGQRMWMQAMHNPVWIAINVYLRGRGLRVDPGQESLVSAAQMEQFFDVNQAIEMAAICDTEVPVLIGAGTELQFPFRGVLKEQKPLRDWLREILNCCAGTYVFSNGKLYPIIRVNSSVLAGNAFTEATILFRSLAISPLQPAFNWIVGQFGDAEYGWQLNNCTVYDIDNAAFLGTPESPQYLVQNLNFSGVSNLSQCARLITTRLREEIGGLANGSGPHEGQSGINEQLNARNFQFKSTVLALGTQLGDIVSLTYPGLPNPAASSISGHGYIEGRVSRWALNPDFSIDFQCSSTTDDMYDLIVGPKPVDVAPPAPPPELLQSPTGLAWMPNFLAPNAGDPIYPPWERTFGLWQDYVITKDGIWVPEIWVEGNMTVNQFASNTQPRILEIELAAGGNLTGPQTVYCALTQRNSQGGPSIPSNLTAIWIAAGLSNQQVTLLTAASTDSSLTGWDLWAGNDRRQIAWQFGGTGAPPTNISLPGPVHNMTEGLPEGKASKVKIQAKHVFHAGIAGLSVNGVTAPNQIICWDFLNSTDNWIGQNVFVCANVAGEVPLWNFTITAFDPTTGTLTVSPNCAGNSDPTQNVQIGDVLIVYSTPSSADANSITNTMWDNSVNRQQYPGSSGMKPGDEKGRIVRILRGTGAGQWRICSDNSSLTHQIAPPWNVVPDHTSIYIVEAPEWLDPAETTALTAAADNVSFKLHTEVSNLSDEVVLVGGFLEDTDGHQTDDGFAAYRMIYVFGQPPTVKLVGPDAGPFDVEVTDEVIRVDSSANDVTLTLLPLGEYQGRNMLVWNSGPNSTIINTTAPDTFSDGTTSFSLSGAGGTARITAGGIYST